MKFVQLRAVVVVRYIFRCCSFIRSRSTKLEHQFFSRRQSFKIRYLSVQQRNLSVLKANQKMGLQQDFEKAAKDVKRLKETPADDDFLELYALYKQGTVGDVTTERPGLLDFKGKAKWDAWDHKKGTDSEKAKQDYVNKTNELIAKVGLVE